MLYPRLPLLLGIAVTSASRSQARDSQPKARKSQTPMPTKGRRYTRPRPNSKQSEIAPAFAVSQSPGPTARDQLLRLQAPTAAPPPRRQDRLSTAGVSAAAQRAGPYSSDWSTSPPARVPNAFHWVVATESRTNRTDPSARATFTPPAW
jgi:hypothetical protein